MKKIIGFLILVAFLGTTASAYAQEQTDTTTVGQDIKRGAKKTGYATKKGAKKTGHWIKKGAKKTGHWVKKGAKDVGNETAELASKGKAKVADKTYKDKVGPNGETIYINKHSKFYWIDDKGKKHYIAKAALKDKTS